MLEKLNCPTPLFYFFFPCEKSVRLPVWENAQITKCWQTHVCHVCFQSKLEPNFPNRNTSLQTLLDYKKLLVTVAISRLWTRWCNQECQPVRWQNHRCLYCLVVKEAPSLLKKLQHVLWHYSDTFFVSLWSCCSVINKDSKRKRMSCGIVSMSLRVVRISCLKPGRRAKCYPGDVPASCLASIRASSTTGWVKGRTKIRIV